MKKMTCSQLGGACELEFFANSFDEIAEKSKQHGMEMFELKEAGHMTAMEKMSKLMADASYHAGLDGKRSVKSSRDFPMKLKVMACTPCKNASSQSPSQQLC